MNSRPCPVEPRWSGASTAHPRETTNSDRRALLEGVDLPLAEALQLEAELGRERLAAAEQGAERFARRNS